MSILHTHVPNNHYSVSRIRVDYASTFPPSITLHLSKEPIPKLTFASSSSSVLPIVVDNGTHNAEQDLKEENRVFDEKEKTRRIRIGHGNKGRVTWNKGRKHSAETRELIKIRTAEALSDPKVKKKMSHTRPISDQTKAKISYAQSLIWQKRQKSKQAGELFFLLWEQNIANAAMKGGSGQGELDWDSYDKIKEQLELSEAERKEKEKLMAAAGAEKKEKEKLMAAAGAEKFIRSWVENIAKAAKEGGSGERELDWDSYEKIKKEMILLKQLRRSSEKAKAKEMAKMKAEKEARIKAIKRVRLTQQKNRDLRRKTKARKNKKSQPYKNTEQDKLEVTPKFKLGSKLTKNHISSNISSEVSEKRDIMYSNFPTHGKLDLELIIREQMQKKVSLAEQIEAAKLLKGKINR